MRLREATRKQIELGELAIERRVAKSLCELAEMMGDREEKGVAVRISQAELAGLAGTTRESISRLLGRTWGEEITLPGRQKIIIRDQGKLAKIASGELILSY
jgi:CRP/FNR family transcriptional regulator